MYQFSLVDEEKMKEVGEIYERVSNANKDYLNLWLEDTFLHWDFWLSVGFTVIPWILFILFRKKDSTHRLLYAGLCAIFITSWFDFIGVMYGLWYYVGKVFPSTPSYMPWDFSILPVAIMLIIQFKPAINPFWKALFFAAFSSFVGEPFFKWIGFYVSIHWNKFYSLPIYFLIYLACHRLSKVNKFEQI